jgi:hypothetical protein
MKIRDIFDRDIDRNINPAVVVSDKKSETIQAEIREYVFTDDLIEKFYKVLDTAMNAQGQKTGVWVNGYYGSGKSHFIKYVHYLLHRETSELAFSMLEKALEHYDDSRGIGGVTPSNLRLLKNKIAAAGCEDILFNVEDETDDADSKERMTRILLNMLNRFRGMNSSDIPLALLLEKPLMKAGVFEAFKERVKADLGFDWGRDAAQAAAFYLRDVLEIAKQFVPAMDVDSLHNRLSHPETFKVSVSDSLIPELQEYTGSKPSDYRLLFLIDEISQYVGSNKEILLNYQSIVEQVGEKCQNKVWIVSTAQQSLEEVSQGVGASQVRDEFGKILGRFDTRISLQSNDASYITKRRVLDKNSQGLAYLSRLYDDKKDFIENQFKISHELYKGYKDKDDFIASYPFVPYQFKLISNVFEAFQQLEFVIKEVKDNERSVLGITHFTTKRHADEPVGGFLPFDAFYNTQFSTNLTHKGANAVENALEVSKHDPFAQRVVKVLFMISNLLESQRQTFPSNVENLAVLLMTDVDENRKGLQNQIKAVLERLQEESVIREEGGSYFFYNEDEIEVQTLITNQAVSMDDRYKTFYDEFFQELTSTKTKVHFGVNDFSFAIRVDDKVFNPRGDFNLQVVYQSDFSPAQLALDASKKDLLVCVHEWFQHDAGLNKEFLKYCKTVKYLLNHTSGATGSRSNTNANFRNRNNELKAQLLLKFGERFNSTAFVSAQQVIEGASLPAAKPKDRMEQVMQRHIGEIYNRHLLSEKYAQNPAAVRERASDKQVLAITTLTPAEELVEGAIERAGGTSTVEELVAAFEKEPFGWRAEAVVDMVVQLARKKRREFRYKGQVPTSPLEFVSKALLTGERSSCTVVAGTAISQDTLDGVIQAYKAVFNVALAHTTDDEELWKNLKGELEKRERDVVDLARAYGGKVPWGATFVEAENWLRELNAKRGKSALFEALIGDEVRAKELFDRVKDLKEFAESQYTAWRELEDFLQGNAEAFVRLAQNYSTQLDLLRQFLASTTPRSELRHAMKAKEELEQGLDALRNELRKALSKTYNGIFDVLEKEAADRRLGTGPRTTRSEFMGRIGREGSLKELERLHFTADAFKTEELQWILQEAQTLQPTSTAQASKLYQPASRGATISNQRELEDYLKSVRSDVEQMLAEGHIIILR